MQTCVTQDHGPNSYESISCDHSEPSSKSVLESDPESEPDSSLVLSSTGGASGTADRGT
jgi:hypothetical protein